MGWLSSFFRRASHARQANAESVQHFNRGNTSLEQHDFEQAIREFTAAISCDPCSLLPYADQLPRGLKKKPFDASDEYYTSPKSFFNRASAYRRLDRLQDAIDDYTRAIDLCPQFRGAYTNRSAVLYEIGCRRRSDGDVAAAEQALMQAEADLDHIHFAIAGLEIPEAFNLISVKAELGSVHIASGQFDKAVKDLGDAVNILGAMRGALPEEAESERRNVCEACSRIGLQIAEVMNSVDPKNSKPTLSCRWAVLGIGLGVILNDFGQWDRAEEVYRRSLWFLQRRASDNRFADDQEEAECLAKAHNHLGLFYQDTGRQDRAVVQFSAALEVRDRLARSAPGNCENRVFLGGTLCNLGNAQTDRWLLEDAEKSYGRALHELRDVLPVCCEGLRTVARQFIANVEGGQEGMRGRQAAPTPPSPKSSCILDRSDPILGSLPRLAIDNEFAVPPEVRHAEDCLTQNEPDTARAEIEAYLVDHSDEPAAWYLSARIHREMGNLAMAMASVEQVLALQPHSAAALLEKADLLRQSGQLEAAEEAVRASLEYDGEHPSAWHLLGLILSETAFSQMLEDTEQPSSAGSPQARLFCLERALKAIDCFDEAIVRQPNEYASRLAKGVILASATRAADVEATLCTEIAVQEIGVELGQLWAKPHSQRFACLLRRTCESFDEASRLRPDESAPLLEKGKFLSGYSGYSHEFDAAALSAYERVVTLDPSNSVARTALGNRIDFPSN